MANVYAIGFPNGKLYIGITEKTAEERLTSHLKDMRAGSKFAIHNALRKYGRNVKLMILTQGVSFDEAKDLEIWWISWLGTMRPGGYNLTKGGDGSVGRKLSQEHKETLLRTSRGYKRSDENKQKLSEIAKGRKLSKETKRKISLAGIGNKYALGFKHSEETKKKMSEAAKRRWEKIHATTEL